MAGYAMKHAAVVAESIIAQVRVGQVPSPDGPAVLPARTVSEYEGADLLVDRFTELFGTA